MKSTIDAIVGILLLLGVGVMGESFYHAVKKEAVTKVHGALGHRLEPFTRQLTGTRLKY